MANSYTPENKDGQQTKPWLKGSPFSKSNIRRRLMVYVLANVSPTTRDSFHHHLYSTEKLKNHGPHMSLQGGPLPIIN